MRYWWCRFNFGGQFCYIKFPHYMVHGIDLRNFRSRPIFVRKHYDHPCLNLNNSKIWRRITEFFSEIVHNFALYTTYAENPLNDAPFFGPGPSEKATFKQKLQFSRPACTNCLSGWCPTYGVFSEGLVFYQTNIAWLPYLRKCVRQRAHSGGLPEYLTLLGAKFRGNPRFWKLPATVTEGVYISCKFDLDIPKGCGI